jgi:hypothetical protein
MLVTYEDEKTIHGQIYAALPKRKIVYFVKQHTTRLLRDAGSYGFAILRATSVLLLTGRTLY